MIGILIGFFNQHIYGKPPEVQDSAPSLLFGVRKSRTFHLYQTAAAPPPAQVERWACIGWGQDLGQYIADLLYKPGQPTKWTEQLATYLVHQAKRHSAYCGGDTDVITLTLDELTPLVRPRKEDIVELERFFDGLNAGLGSILMTGLDTALSDEAVHHRLTVFTEWVKEYRRVAQRRKQAIEDDSSIEDVDASRRLQRKAKAGRSSLKQRVK